jgi:uncharacterized protein YutE (UPF0331/DUF86 family)
MATEGEKLYKLIKKAMDDLELSTSEYEEILAQVHSDGVVDEEEQQQLNQLNELLANGTIKRVPG